MRTGMSRRQLKPGLLVIFGRDDGAAGEIRTLDLVLRRHALYPSELQPHAIFYTTVSIEARCLRFARRHTNS